MSESSTEAPKSRSWVVRRLIELNWLLIVGMIVSTVATSFAHWHWSADLLANLRVQQVIAILFAFAIALLYRSRIQLFLCVFLFAMHAVWFDGGASDHEHASNDSNQQIRITVANVLTRNRRHDDVIRELKKHESDFIAVLELSSELDQEIRTQLASSHPYVLARAQDRSNFGIGVYSRIALTDQEVVDLNSGVDSIAVTLGEPGKQIRVYATHPVPPMGNRGFKARNDHLQKLAARISDFRRSNPDIEVVTLGDLNLTPWSPWFTKFEHESRLRRASDGFDLTPTWYLRTLFPFGLVLDHVLISPGLHCVSHEVGKDMGSDHRSVTVTLGLGNSTP